MLVCLPESNSAGRRFHLLGSAISSSTVRKKTMGHLAGFPVQVVPRHSQYSLRMARPVRMPLCWAVPYSRLRACESCASGRRLWWEAANHDGDGASEFGAAIGGMVIEVGCERGERRRGQEHSGSEKLRGASDCRRMRIARHWQWTLQPQVQLHDDDRDNSK